MSGAGEGVGCITGVDESVGCITGVDGVVVGCTVDESVSCTEGKATEVFIAGGATAKADMSSL